VEPLTASGYPGRWNKPDQFVIYAAESRSLASLEWLVNRGGRILSLDFVLITLKLKVEVKDIKILNDNLLMNNWRSLGAYSSLQELGSQWYKDESFKVLSVPSALVPEERNLVIHQGMGSGNDYIEVLDIHAVEWLSRLQW
jgi:RES domain-containing protein